MQNYHWSYCSVILPASYINTRLWWLECAEHISAHVHPVSDVSEFPRGKKSQDLFWLHALERVSAHLVPLYTHITHFIRCSSQQLMWKEFIVSQKLGNSFKVMKQSVCSCQRWHWQQQQKGFHCISAVTCCCWGTPWAKGTLARADDAGWLVGRETRGRPVGGGLPLWPW